MKVSIGLGSEENVAEQTTTFHITFTQQELVQMGPPPSYIMMQTEHESWAYHPEFNAKGCDTPEFKLLRIAWMLANAREYNDQVIESNGEGYEEFFKRIRG